MVNKQTVQTEIAVVEKVEHIKYNIYLSIIIGHENPETFLSKDLLC